MKKTFSAKEVVLALATPGQQRRSLLGMWESDRYEGLRSLHDWCVKQEGVKEAHRSRGTFPDDWDYGISDARYTVEK